MSAPAVAEIPTERLSLRPIEVGDVASFAHMLADSEIVRFISDGSTATEVETAEWIELSIRRNAFDGFDKYATEVGEGMRDHAMPASGLRCVIALIHPDNDASKHVARKLGFAYERDTEFHGRTVELFVLEA